MNTSSNEDRKDLIITHVFEAPHARILAAWSEPELPKALNTDVILTFAEDGPSTCVVLKYQDITMISEETCEVLQEAWDKCFVQIENRLKQNEGLGQNLSGSNDPGQSKTPCDEVDNMGRLPRCEL